MQVLTFYSGMPAVSVEKDITNRMERWTGQANDMSRQESRSIVGASIVRNYFQGNVDPNGALGQVMSLSTGAIPNLPPGTLPPVVLPFDPTATVPACIVALDSQTQNESILYDVGRYEVRNMIMAIPGAVAPVVFGGKVRTVLAYLDRQKMQARHLSLADVMNALDNYNLFMPTGDAKFGDTDYAIDSNSMYNVISEMKGIPLRIGPGTATFLGRRRHAQGCQFHSDQRRAGQRPPTGLHSGLSAARFEHADGRRSASRKKRRGSNRQ